jgi:nucleoside-diphosphate-sugar epimerase
MITLYDNSISWYLLQRGFQMKNIAITGGTGFIGTHMIERLLADGHRVSCLVLPRQKYTALPDVTYFEGNIMEPASLEGFLQNTQTIIHLAGLTRAKTEQEFLAINAEGTASLVDAAKKYSPDFSHIIAMSSLAAIGPSNDDCGHCEEEPFKPISSYGRSKAKLEEYLQKQDLNVHWTAIRAPGVYGPYDRDFLQYFKLVNKRVRLVIGKRNVMSLVYVKNLVSAIATCVDNPAAYNQAFFISDDGCYDWDDIGKMIEASLGKKSLRISIPFWVVRGASMMSELMKPMMKNPPLITKDKLAEMSQSYWVVSCKKAHTLLGYTPSYTTSDAFQETGKWYRTHGWL